MILLNILFLVFFSNNAFSAEMKIDDVKEEFSSLLDKKYILLPHKGNFLLPFSYNFKPNHSAQDSLDSGQQFSERGEFNQNMETEFQISFMVLTSRNIFNTDLNLFVGYTHQAWWQVFNEEWSRPFRETNYAPELFVREIFDSPKKFLGLDYLAYDVGVIHQSNGEIQELSRSWNRIFLRTAFVFGKTFLKASLWYRIPESKSKDENRDIYDYLGYGELEIDHFWKKNRFQLRIIPGTKHQGAELSYSYPLSEGIRFFTKAGYGYGLSLLDYSHESQKIGLGFVLSDILTH